jgi:hypothetical protein
MNSYVFPKSGNHIKTVRARRVKSSKFHTEDSQLKRTTGQNFVTLETWTPGFGHPWNNKLKTKWKEAVVVWYEAPYGICPNTLNETMQNTE